MLSKDSAAEVVRNCRADDDAMRHNYTSPSNRLPTMFAPRSIKHCRACGAEVQYLVPVDDNRDRATCTVCTTIHYENPLNVVGTLPVWEDKVLLCRRAIEPRHGLWTLPAGVMELGETTEQGALRETAEEAGARVELEGLYSMINVVRVGQVHLFYRARMLDIDFVPGPESLEARLFAEHEVPWDEIAFRTTKKTLEFFFADRRDGRYGLHLADIT
jgi:ADP-ribose pyrophosphatase YjhB (NUDIX family)